MTMENNAKYIQCISEYKVKAMRGLLMLIQFEEDLARGDLL